MKKFHKPRGHPQPGPERSAAPEAGLGALAPGAESAEEKIERLESELAERDALLAETRERYLRALADLDNQRKRSRQERLESQLHAVTGLLLELLAILDNLDRALEAATKVGKVETLLEGVRLIRRQTAALLERRGVAPFVSLRQPFDPAWHEAVRQVPTLEAEEGIIVEEIEKGYRLGNRLLRPAKVGVAARPGGGATRGGGAEGEGEVEAGADKGYSA